MFNRKLKYSIMLFLLVVSFVLSGIIYFSRKTGDLKIIFLDVGQGDAILISQGSYQMLVDGGRNGKSLLEKLGKYVPFWDRRIEVIVATHPDQDHIAGLIDVLEKYEVGTVIKTQDKSQSQTYGKLEEEIENEKANNIEAKKGTLIKFSGDISAEILYPFSETGDMADNKSNSGSAVMKIVYGENSFLLAGDLPKEQEISVINSGGDIHSRVLKAAHHGSKYSTSPEFLERVDPTDAIISVGKDNSYGHPNGELLNLLEEKNINILRTDERGDIIYRCKKYSVCGLN